MMDPVIQPYLQYIDVHTDKSMGAHRSTYELCDRFLFRSTHAHARVHTHTHIGKHKMHKYAHKYTHKSGTPHFSTFWMFDPLTTLTEDYLSTTARHGAASVSLET